MRVFMTGGCGFIGSNLTRFLHQSADEVLVYDALTYAGRLGNILDMLGQGVVFVHDDICNYESVLAEMQEFKPSVILHLAAESHVDNSISDPAKFVKTNVEGTFALLEAARQYQSQLEKFVYISTDEVFGSLRLGHWPSFESDRFNPTSPYAATKAAATHLVQSYFKTYGLPTVVLIPSNNYGPYQHPEKFIPNTISKALNHEPIPIYGDGLYIRNWLYVNDFCAAAEKALQDGAPGEWYNVGSDVQITNLAVARSICDILGVSHKLIEHVGDRPGHDRRYALNSHLINADLKWRATTEFEQGLGQTIEWYQNHQEWLSPQGESNE